MIPVTLIREGRTHTIVAWGATGDCAYEEFLSELHKRGDKGAAKIAVAVKMLAEVGPPRQEEKGHEVHGSKCKKLYELKPGDYRVVWFYGKERTIVITHIFPKKKAKYPRECARASSIMKAYWKEINNADT